MVVGERVLGTLSDQRAGQRLSGPRLAQRGGVLVDTSTLGVGAGMTTQLEQDHEFPHPPTVRLLRDHGRGTRRIERCQALEIQISAAPVAAYDRGEHRLLLRGCATIDFDRSEQHAADRFDHRVFNDSRHGRDRSRRRPTGRRV